MGTKRMAINVVATYAQTAVSLVVGIFSSRWVYNALGETKFGLFAVVGALIAFVAILDNALITTSSRFFAFAIGQQRKPDGDKELLCKWFNTALSVQAILPLGLVLVGGPIGVYAILNWLTIPDELRMSCVWVFGISLFTVFQTMLFSPVRSLFYAKQYIFVRNLFAICNTVLLAAGGWRLLQYNGDRLLAWAVFGTVLSVVTNIAYAIVAHWQFPEARIRPRYWFDKKRLKEMFSFTLFLLLGSLGGLLSNSGVAIILNKFFGPIANAAMGIGQQAGTKADLLAMGVYGAIQPEISTKVGAEDWGGARRLAVRVCIYSVALNLIIASPFIVYVQDILVLWLKTPARYAADITVIILACFLAERVTMGYVMLMTACGRIKKYMIVFGVVNGMRCLAVFVLLWGGVSLIPALWMGWFLPLFVLTQVRVWLEKRALGAAVSVRYYVTEVLIPICAMGVASFAFSFGFKAWHGDSIPMILLCVIGNAITVALLFWLVIGASERNVLLCKITTVYTKFRGALKR